MPLASCILWWAGFTKIVAAIDQTLAHSTRDASSQNNDVSSE